MWGGWQLVSLITIHGQVTDNLCVIKICRSRSKRCSSFQQTRSKAILKFTIILILGTMNNIFHINFLLFVAGSWDLLDVMMAEDAGLSVTVERDTVGVPSYEAVTFMYGAWWRARPVRVGANITEVL